MANPNTPSIAQSFKPGDKLAGCYTLKEILPDPGVCTVWLAHDEELGKDIALHFIPDAVAADARAMSELKQEAKRNRQLIHPRIVRVHDLVEDEKWCAISMDHVKGDPISLLQKQHDKNAYNPSEIAAGVAELCQTVEDAHRIDLFHRDLTPDNLIATANGLMVQKFGISRVILDSLARSGNPVQGGRDLAYISPQQLDGERPGRADDLYSLGATLFDILTGASPFAEGDPIPQIRKTVPPLVSERRAARQITAEPVPKVWDETIAACLAKNPEERPKSAADAGTRFASGKPTAQHSAPSAAATAAATATGAVAVTEATAAKPAPSPPAAKAEPAPKSEPPQTAPAPEDPSSRQQKRNRQPGPGKAPVIAEATVLSKTPVPKGDAAKDPAPSGPAAAAPADSGTAKKPAPGATTPSGFPLQAFVGVDTTAPKPKSHAGAIAVIVGLLLIIFVAYRLASNKSAPATSDSGIAATGTSSAAPDQSATQETPAASPVAGESPAAAPTPVNIAANSVPISTSAATPPLSDLAPPAPAPDPPAPPTVAALAALTSDQAAQLIVSKSKAVEDAKTSLAAAAEAARATAAAQAKAAAAAQAIQASIKDKAAAAAAAKAAEDSATAALKQQQDTLDKAEADAAAAQKAAEDKIQAATQIRKTFQDTQLAAQKQAAARKQAEADAAAATQAAADRQKAADDAAKAALDAEKARAARAQALEQAQADLNQTQSALQQAQQTQASEKAREQAAAAASAEQQRQQEEARKAAAQAAASAAQLQQQHAAEAARLAAQAAAAAKAADDARKALAAAQKAVADAEQAQHAAELQAQALASGSPAPSPSAAPTVAPSATPVATPPSATPVATPPPAAASPTPVAATPVPATSPVAETPLPVASPSPLAAASPSAAPAASPAATGTTPSVSVQPPSPNAKVDQALVNSLGMRFAPVGKLLFSVWLTRVQDFQAFASATGFANQSWLQPGFKQGPDHPVVNVSWNDANAFCLWLTEKEHRAGILAINETYRLPTDLEWSKAVGLPPEVGPNPEARDMDIPDVYPWGTQWPPPSGAGNYTGEETDSDIAIKGYNDGFAWTSPVGSFTPNKFGLYDMGGNVWEWVADWWNSEQKARVLRGASWYNGALKISLLSSCRDEAGADERTDNYGFRVVISEEILKPKSTKHHSAAVPVARPVKQPAPL